MIFLRRLFLRAAVSEKRVRLSGQMSVWLALCFLVFLSLYLACWQSVKKQLQRQQAEQAVESGMFSLFSEYEPHLLKKYDLFYLDTSFRSGKERIDELCSHLWKFVKDPLTSANGELLYGMELQGVNVKDLVRMTDNKGQVFYHQAVKVIKQKTGASFLEDWVIPDGILENMERQYQIFQKDCVKYEGVVEDYEAEEEELEAEAYEWDGIRSSFTLSMLVPGKAEVSSKGMNQMAAPSGRALSAGAGYINEKGNQILEKQWFLQYLCEYMTQAQEKLQEERAESFLDYQLEYVLCGKATDRENLETALQTVFFLREGVNYVFLLSHPSFSKQAEALALLLGGMTGSTSLIKALKHLILLGWACGESMVEVRQLLGGYELSVIKEEEDWQVSLSELLWLAGNPGIYDAQKNTQKGIGYEGYLRMLLMLKSEEELAMRALDVIEGELRQMDGCQKIHLDHCVESLTAQVWLQGIYLERTYGYE